jgi:TP901 family phage tail tape measure protein
MAGAISSLYVEFSASTKKFSDAMGEVTRSVKEVDKVLKPIKERAADVGKALTAGLTVPLLGLGAAALSSAMKIDEAMDDIRAATGATGSTLDTLNKDFHVVFSQVPNSIEDVSKAIGDLNARTGLAGKPLQELATQMLNVSKLTKTEIGETIASTTRVFGDWNIATDKQSEALDFLFKVGQKTGIQFGTLSRSVQEFGVPLREMGFSFEQAAVLLGKFEKEGVNADVVMAALRKSLGTLAKAGITDSAAALNILVDRIQKAGSASQANAVAIQIFGAKAGPTLAAAIREGHFAIDDLLKSIQKSPETINKATEATRSFGEKMDILKHKAMEALEPIGVSLLDAMERLIPTAERLLKTVANLADSFSKMKPGTQDAVIGISAVLLVAGPAITVLTKISSTIVGLIALASKLGISFSGVAAAFSAAPLILAVRSYGDLQAAISLIGSTSILATGGLVALAGAIGVGIGLIVNWVLKITGLEASVDKLVSKVASFVHLTGEWGNGQDAITNATAMSVDATKRLTDELTKRNIVFDKTRLNDANYVSTLGQQIKAQTEAVKTTTSLGSAAKATAGDIAKLNKALESEASKKAREELEKLNKEFQKSLRPADELNKELDKLKSSGANNAQILVTYAKQIVEAADAQRAHGIIVSGTTRKLEEEARALLDTQENTKAYADATKQAADAHKQLLDSFQAAIRPADELNKSLDDLLQSGKDAADVAMIYATQIIAAADAQRANGQVVTGATANLYDLAQGYAFAASEAKKLSEEVKKEDTVFSNSQDAVFAAIQQQGELTDAINKYKSIGLSSLEIQQRLNGAISTAATNQKELGLQLDPVTAAMVKQQKATNDGIAAAKKWHEVWVQAMGNVVSSFADGVSSMIFEGQHFSSVLSGIFKELSKTILKMMITDTFTKIAGSFTKMLGGFSSKIGSLLGVGGSAAQGAAGTAAGTAAGAGSGLGAIGALATNPITIAAAGALAAGLAIKHFVGQGRRTANEFVQGTQNPLDKNLSFLIDTFDNAKKAGTLTLDEAKQTKEALTTLWQGFLASSSDFAKQGKTEAKVVGQAMDTYTKAFGSNLGALFADVDSGIAALQNPQAGAAAAGAAAGGPQAGIPQTTKAVSASTIFADAVDAFKNVVDNIGTMIAGKNTNQQPITINMTSAPVINLDGATVTAADVRDIIMPEILDDFSKNARGSLETLVRILQSGEPGVTSSGGTAA